MSRVDHRRVRAMGGVAEVVVVHDGDEDLANVAVERIAALEQAWSRFRPDSDVSRLNAAGGRPVPVRGATAVLLERAATASRRTHGWFAPGLGDAVVAAGYDRSLADLRDRVDERLPPPPPDVRRRGSAPVQPFAVDLVAERERGPVTCSADDDVVTSRRWLATVAPGTRVDAGGIGKGLAADLVVAQLRARSAGGVLVNLGGDVRAWGRDETGRPWTVALADDARAGHADGDTVLVQLDDAAVTTSTTLRRRWRDGAGRERHHLVDAATRRPTTHDVVSVTVVADAAWWADAAATAVLSAGRRGIGLAVELGLDARITFSDHSFLGLGRLAPATSPA